MDGSSVLVEITQDTHCVLIDMVYAGSGNIAGQPLYETERCWLHRDAEPRLVRAVELASLVGMKLKILDAYRSPQAHERLCKHISDPRYIADPKRGSNHSRGVAVDLTLVDGEGRELDMGTTFDAMVEPSHHFHPSLPPEVQRNRFLLLAIMTQAGFVMLAEEWWHYQMPDARSYPLIRPSDPPVMESGPWR
jgi:D-alanyl-D-alanine dipeptidase